MKMSIFAVEMVRHQRGNECWVYRRDGYGPLCHTSHRIYYGLSEDSQSRIAEQMGRSKRVSVMAGDWGLSVTTYAPFNR